MHHFEDESKKLPTCFEDCPKESQEEWLKSLDKDALKVVVKNLGKKFREIGGQFDIEA